MGRQQPVEIHSRRKKRGIRRESNNTRQRSSTKKNIRTKTTHSVYLEINPRDTTEARDNAESPLSSGLEDDSISLTAGSSAPVVAPFSVCTSVTESCFEPLRGGGESDMNSNSPSSMGVPGALKPAGGGRKGLRGGS